MFESDRYLVRKKVFKMLGGAFHVWDESGNLVAFSEQKAFKLKEDIRVFADESKTVELLSIKARNIIDFSAVYDVVDSASGQAIGSLMRKGAKSIIRDEWMFADPSGTPFATLIEDSMLLALLRRLLTNLVPQRYDVFAPDAASGTKIANMDQNFNPFVYRLNVDFSMDPQRRLDKRLGIAAAILLAAIEGRQQ
jgi:hypothetical protein